MADIKNPVMRPITDVQVAPTAVLPVSLTFNGTTTTYATIQAAVNAAVSGGSITIAAGTYVEQVTVSNRSNLTITGMGEVIVRSPAGALAANGVTSSYGGPVYANIAVNNSTNVTIRNVQVDGDYAGDRTVGVVPGFNGATDEISGITYINSSGTIDAVRVLRVSNSPAGGLFGLQLGSGIFIDGTTFAATSVAITGSTITDFQKTGILVLDTNATITGNTITGIGFTTLTAQNAIQLGNSGGTVSNNTVSGFGYDTPEGGTVFEGAGIIAYELTGALAITNNRFTGSGAEGFVGAFIEDVDQFLATVTGNTVSNATAGFILSNFNSDPETPAIVNNNTFNNVADSPGTSGNDTINTGAGNDIISGLDGNDTIESGAGNDQVYGGNGNDTIIAGAGEGDDFYDGGAGIDTITFLSATQGVAVDLNEIDRSANSEISDLLAAVPLPTNTPVGIAIGAQTGTDALRSIENVTTGAGNDTIFGNQFDNVIDAGAGDDIVRGGLGNDTLIGGAGVDTLDYSVRTTTVQVNLAAGSVNAGAGDLDSVSGFENAILGSGDDQFTGDAGANSVTGGAGDDQLNGGAGSDVAIYNGTIAADGLATQIGATLLFNAGINGTDQVSNIETLRFQNGPDTLNITVDNGNAVVASRKDAAAITEGDLGVARTTAATGVLSNDVNLDQGGADLKFVAAVNGSAANVGVAVVGTYGSLTLQADGTYSYVANQAAINALSGGEVVTDTFAYTADDNDTGTSLPANLVITITGANDVPVLGGDQIGVVTEDTAVAVATTIDTDSFEDGGEGWFLTGTSTPANVSAGIAGTQGGSDGAFLGQFGGSDNNPAVETVSKTFTLGTLPNGTIDFDFLKFDSWDRENLNNTGRSGFIDETLTVFINGTAAFSFLPGGNGQIGNTQQIGELPPGVLTGVFTVGGITGTWTVTPDTPTDIDLGSNQGPIFFGDRIYSVRIDFAGATGSITLGFGSNIGPDTANDSSFGIDNVVVAGFTDTPGTLNDRGTITIADADDGESTFAPQTTVGNYGTFTLNAAGNWTYSAVNSQLAIQQLGQGQTLTETFTAVSSDGTASEPVTITINGVNDAPVITNNTEPSYTQALTETNATITATPGRVLFSDIDLNDTPTAAITSSVVTATGITLTADQISAITAAFSVTNAGTGAYAFSLPSPDYLDVGDVVTATFTVTVSDQHGGSATQDVVYTITGTNDEPIITSGPQAASLTESDAPLTATGTVTASDADIGSTVTYTVAGPPAITSNNGLTAAQEAFFLDSFGLSVDSNGDPEDSPTFTVDPQTGVWTYSIQSPDFLAAGETVQINYRVLANDGNGGTTSQNVSITINGTNDAPVVVVNAPQSLVNDTINSALSLDGLFTTTANAHVADATTIPHASVEVVSSGTVEYFSFTVGEGGSDVTIDIDQLLYLYDTTFAIYDADGVVVATADDTEDFSFASDPGSTRNRDGVLTLNLDAGVYYIAVDAYLGVGNGAEGNPLPEGATFTLNVSVANPGITPSYGADLVETNANLTVDGQVQFSDFDTTGGEGGDTATASYDPDDTTVTAVGITLTDAQIQAIAGGFDLTDETTGAYTFAIASLDYLAAGDVVTAVFNVVVSDGDASVTQPVTITITGTNDAPVLNDATYSINDGPVFESFSITAADGITIAPLATDVDSGDTRTFALVSEVFEDDTATVNPDGSTTITTDFGVVTLALDGTVTFAADDEAINGLIGNNTVQRIFTVRVTDSEGASDTATFTINLNGSNENPVFETTPLVFSTDDNFSQNNQSNAIFDLLQGASDPDVFDGSDDLDIVAPSASNVTYTTAGTPLTPGQQALVEQAVRSAFATGNFNAENGTVAFNTGLFDFLDEGQSVIVSLSYTVTDANSGSATQSANITINGALENGGQGTPFDDTITTTQFGDSVFGGAGDDVIYALAGADFVSGDDGDDFIDGGSGNDTLFGGLGDDTVVGGAGDDTIYGDERFSGLFGGEGAGDNILDGGAGNDTIYTGLGNNTVTGGSGNDAIYIGSAGSGGDGGEGGLPAADAFGGVNTVDGGSGTDTLFLSGRFSEYTITRVPGVANSFRFERVIDEDGTVEQTTVINVERFSFDGSVAPGTGPQIVTNDVPVVGNSTFSVPETTGSQVGTVVGNVGATDADTVLGDTLTYTLTGTGAENFVIDANGRISFADTIDFETDQTAYTLTVTATDEAGQSDTGIITINITNVAEPVGPIAVDTTLTVNEIAANGTVIGTASASDPDAGSVITYSLGNDAGGRFAIDPTTGVITVVNGILLDFEQNASHAITVVATSSDSSSTTTPFTVTITDVNPETVVGTDAAETVVGGAGDDSFTMNGGNDTVTGGGGNDTISGGAGTDTVNINISTDGADSVDLGGDLVDIVNVSSDTPGQVRLSFTSAQVGNGNPLDSNTLPNQDGGLAVRMQAEDSTGALTGPVTRLDDEGQVFVAGAGVTFDVRDITNGVQRGDQFEVAVLGTSADDTLTAVQGSRPYYFNGGMGNDTITGGTANDFFAGGAGNDTLNGGDGDDTFLGGGGNDTIIGGAGTDRVLFAPSTDGVDQINLGGDAIDVITVTAPVPTNIRLTFTSSEIGNGNANDAGTMLNQDGGLAVRIQQEDASGALTGGVSRADDEGQVFIGGAGVTFDVRDLVSGAQRGEAFEVVILGTDASETQTALQDARPYYFNLGMGDDTIVGGSANDFLVGGAGNDTLSGAGGDNRYIGGLGNDTINGGAGIDTIVAFNITTDGADTINLGLENGDIINVSATAPTQVRVTFTSSEVGNGNAFDSNTLTNQDGGLAMRIQAEDGSDGLTGPVTRADDEGTILIAGTGVTFDIRDLPTGVSRGNSFEVAINGTAADDIQTAVQNTRPYYFNGGAGNDTQTGGSGNDFFAGGAGNDTMTGFAGNNGYLGGGGIDTVTYALAPAAVSINLTTGTGANGYGGTDSFTTVENVIGTAFADVITGDGAANALTGGDGDDILDGAGGDDVLSGGNGNDLLFGGAGTNTLTGGTGDDQYYVNNSSDVVTEVAGEGFDTVIAFANFALAANADIEVIAAYGTATTLTGSSISNIIVGNALDNVLSGLGGNDIIQGQGGDDDLFGGVGNDRLEGGDGADDLYGEDGNDALIGGAGSDLLIGGTGSNYLEGGAGDDIYIIQSATDIVVDGPGGGFDTVVTFFDFALDDGSEIEVLAAYGSATTLTGSASDNIIVGNTLNNILSGMAGNDIIQGAEGDDVLSGGTGNDRLEGGTGDDTLLGGSGADALIGDVGADILTGGSGGDYLEGGAGADTFRFDNIGGVDTIADFVSGTDKIALDGSVFTSTATINLVTGSGPLAAPDTNSTFFYDSTTGVLSYDADGSGAGAAVDLANIGAGQVIVPADLIFY